MNGIGPRDPPTGSRSLDPDLGTDRVRAELGPRSVRSGTFQLAAQVGKMALYAVTGMVLARLLTPRDFGVYAMAMSLVALVRSVQDFGFPLATVQRETLGAKHLEGSSD